MSTTIEPTAEAVLKLPGTQKRALLLALARDLLSEGPIDLGDGIVVYPTVPNARELAEESLRNDTPEERAELDRRAATPEDAIGFDEMMRIIDQIEDEDEEEGEDEQ